MYDITDDEVKKVVEQESNANASFEEFTEIYDKKQEKEFREG